MPLRCPKCRTPSLLFSSEVDARGKLVRCPRCSATWLARHFGATVYGPAQLETPPPVIPRQPLIIEGRIATAMPHPRPFGHAPTAPAASSAVRPDMRRYGFAAAAAALVATLIAIVLLTPAVSALPGIARLSGHNALDTSVAVAPADRAGDR